MGWSRLPDRGGADLGRRADLDTAWPASAITVSDAADQTAVPANYTRKEAIVPIDSARKFVRVNATEP